MSRSPTYVSRLDPQFRRFVNVVNVYPSSETSASNDDLSKDGALSLASSSCSEINQEFISVDAYTEENWPPPQSSQRQVSELYLEYANVLSSESETSFGNDNDIGIVTSPNLREAAHTEDAYTEENWPPPQSSQRQVSELYLEYANVLSSESETSFGNDHDTAIVTSPNLQEDAQNLSNSEQLCSPDRIRNDSFGDDSVFWSDGHGEISHEGNGINQCLQKQLSVSNKRPTFNRPHSSEADSESSYKYCKDSEGRLEHFEDNEGFFAGRNTQWHKNISPVSRQPVEEVIARGPLNTSRKIADSLDDLSSLDSELGYAPDVIEDGYSSTSSADSSFVCFALVGNQDDKRTKRKMASKNGRGERHKKHRYSEGDLSRRREIDDQGSDRGLMACVVTGISGGPAIRVYRDDDSHRPIKSKSRPFEYVHENAQPYLGRTKGGAANSDALSGSQLQNERSRTNSRESVFALFASPENPPVKKKQSDRSEKKCDMEKMDSRDPRSADSGKGILPEFPKKYSSSRPFGDGKKPPAIKTALKENVQPNVLSKQLFGEIRRDSPSWSPDERQPISYVARQKQMPGVNEDGKDQRSSESINDPLTRRFMYETVQRKAVPVKLQSTKREVTPKASRKPSSKGQRSERNQHQEVKDALKPAVHVSEGRPQDTKKISQQTDLNWPPKGQECGNDDQVGIPSEPDRDEKVVHHSLPLESESMKAFDPYKQQQDSQNTGNLELEMENPREEEDTGAKAKTEFLTPVRQAIHKTIQTCFSDNDVYDDDWKNSSNEEDQVCPENPRDESSATELESLLKGLQTNSARVPSKDEELEEVGKDKYGYKEKISKQDFDVSVNGVRQVPNIESVDNESVDAIGAPKPDRVSFQEGEVDCIDLQTERSFDTDFQPVEDSCDHLHSAKGKEYESHQFETDNRHSKDDISKLPNPTFTQGRLYTHVTKRKHSEDKRQEEIHSKKTKSRLEVSPKTDELLSELSGDLSGPSKDCEPHSPRRFTNVTDRRKERQLEEDRGCPSSDNMLRPSKADEKGGQQQWR